MSSLSIQSARQSKQLEKCPVYGLLLIVPVHGPADLANRARIGICLGIISTSKSDFRLES